MGVPEAEFVGRSQAWISTLGLVQVVEREASRSVDTVDNAAALIWTDDVHRGYGAVEWGWTDD